MARPKKTTTAKAIAAAETAVETAVETVKEKAAAAKKTEVMYLQIGGSEWNLSDCKEKAVCAYKAAGHKSSSIKSLELYVKPEEGKVYYVINKDENGSVDL